MVNELFLVVGLCNRETLEDIQERVNEKLSPVEEHALRFVPFDVLSANPIEQVQRLRAQIDTNLMGYSGPDLRCVNVVVLFDGGKQEANELSAAVRELRNGLVRDGTQSRFFHLIWMVSEDGNNAAAQHEICRILYQDITSQSEQSEKVFDYLYILSDKRSNLQFDKEARIDAAALLTSVLIYCKRPASGIYTAGAGKRSISSREMKIYAQDRIVDAILNGNMNHVNNMREICKQAFDEPEAEDLGDALCRKVNRCLNSEFCLIMGREGSESAADPNDHSRDFDTDIMDSWHENIRGMLENTLFTKDAVHFFTNREGFLNMTEEAETKAAQDIGNAFQPLKVPMFGEKKRIIAAYNRFAGERKRTQMAMLSQLVSDWRDHTAETTRRAEEINNRMSEYLDGFRAHSSFMEKCRRQAAAITEQIEQKVAVLEFGQFVEGLSKDRDLLTALNDALEECAKDVTNGVSDKILIEEALKKSPEDLKRDTLDEIDNQARVVMSCMSYGVQFDFLSSHKVIFIPNRLKSRMGVALENLLGTNCELVGAEDKNYQNIEEMILVPIRQPQSLTLFVNSQASVTSEKSQERAEERDKTSFRHIEKQNGKQTEKQTGDDSDNPWEIRADDSFRLHFIWREPTASSISCQITDARGTTQTIPISKNEFMMKGFWDASQAIAFGRHTVAILLHGEVISKAEIRGRRHQIRIECSQEDFNLGSGELFLNKFKLTIASVDGDPNNCADDVFCRNVLLGIPGTCMEMPMPEIKKRHQVWTVYKESSALPQIRMREGVEDSYQVLLV